MLRTKGVKISEISKKTMKKSNYKESVEKSTKQCLRTCLETVSELSGSQEEDILPLQNQDRVSIR